MIETLCYGRKPRDAAAIMAAAATGGDSASIDGTVSKSSLTYCKFHYKLNLQYFLLTVLA